MVLTQRPTTKELTDFLCGKALEVSGGMEADHYLVVLDGTVGGYPSLSWRMKSDFRRLSERQVSYALRTKVDFARFCGREIG